MNSCISSGFLHVGITPKIAFQYVHKFSINEEAIHGKEQDNTDDWAILRHLPNY